VRLAACQPVLPAQDAETGQKVTTPVATGCKQPVLSSIFRATENDRLEPGLEGRVVEGLKRTKHGLQATSGTIFHPWNSLSQCHPAVDILITWVCLYSSQYIPTTVTFLAIGETCTNGNRICRPFHVTILNPPDLFTCPWS